MAYFNDKVFAFSAKGLLAKKCYIPEPIMYILLGITDYLRCIADMVDFNEKLIITSEV